MKKACICGGLLLAVCTQVFAAGSGGHADPVAPILLTLIVILGVAKLSSELFERLGQPAVLGELLGGVLLGNLILLNPEWNFFERVARRGAARKLGRRDRQHGPHRRPYSAF